MWCVRGALVFCFGVASGCLSVCGTEEEKAQEEPLGVVEGPEVRRWVGGVGERAVAREGRGLVGGGCWERGARGV